MTEEILINVTPREIRIAYLDNKILQDIHIERKQQQGIVGNIYKGKVTRLLPGIQAAFVNIGLERAAFLHIKDMVNPLAHVDIRDLLHPGQELLVQVYKDPLGSKGARLTTQFAIPARYLVLTPYANDILVSQKIMDDIERQRLLTMLPEADVGGYIFRTAAIGATQNHIDADKQFLKKVWLEISARAKQVKAGHIVFTEIPLVLKILRDLNGSVVEKIYVDHTDVAQEMREFAQRYFPELVARIEYYAEQRPIFDVYGVENELQKALQRKVHLQSGGYLVFDQTEAMTTIDVNTGSYLGQANHQDNLEETIYKTNVEAANVIARQVRLRNLGGIIIIDFIDMLNPSNKANLLEIFNKALAKDNARTEISELSSLGLIQMTRKRTRESLEHILCVACPVCHRRGSIKSLQTLCYDIFRELKQVAYHFPNWPGYAVVATDAVINYVVTEESILLKELEAHFGKPIQLRAASTFMQEHFEIVPIADRK